MQLKTPGVLTGIERDILRVEIPATFHRVHLDIVSSSCREVHQLFELLSFITNETSIVPCDFNSVVAYVPWSCTPV